MIKLPEVKNIKNDKIIKPWGHEIIWAQTEKYVAKILKINAGHRLSKQYHEKKEETILVQDGILYLELEGLGVEKILPGNIVHIPPNTIHRFGANESSVTLIEVSTTELEDVVRLEDDYQRI